MENIGKSEKISINTISEINKYYDMTKDVNSVISLIYIYIR